MPAGDSAERRRNLLEQLRYLLEENETSWPSTNQQDPCCPPIIEMYDPCPKPAIPLACPPFGSPLDPDIPVPHVACPTNPFGGVIIPIIAPQPIPCIPIANDIDVEQPCVPCNPPTMMVCYRREHSSLPNGMNHKKNNCNGNGHGHNNGNGNGGSGGECCSGAVAKQKHIQPLVFPCKSREIKSSILKVGCDCWKKNGLQDQCPRTECQGRHQCLTDPPTCCPAQVDMMRWEQQASRNGGGNCGGCNSDYTVENNGQIKAEYLCYPAYFKVPPCNPYCLMPCSPFGGPSPCEPIAPACQGPCKSIDECCPLMPQCCPPIPTIPLPPCPPITIPAPPRVMSAAVPIPIPTPIYPMCPICPPDPC